MIHNIRELVQEDLEVVQQLITDKIQSQISLIEKMSSHIVKSGGKRLRPLLVLLASKACGYQGQDHIKLAAMIEFFHTATLLHDDVIDESKMRRGAQTANEIWGSKASILVGDYLFTQYMQLMIEVGDLPIMRLLTDISHQIGCGEIKQLSNRNNPALTETEYFEIIKSKTSLLFAASATLGALIGKQPEAIQKALFDYGLCLGNAFQLIDDALDYCSDANTLGKNIGDDLADGKATLPLIHAMFKGNSAQQAVIKKSLLEGTLDHLPEIIQALEETQSIQYTKSLAAYEVDKAITALQLIPDSPFKISLIEFAKYAVEREY